MACSACVRSPWREMLQGFASASACGGGGGKWEKAELARGCRVQRKRCKLCTEKHGRRRLRSGASTARSKCKSRIIAPGTGCNGSALGPRNVAGRRGVVERSSGSPPLVAAHLGTWAQLALLIGRHRDPGALRRQMMGRCATPNGSAMTMMPLRMMALMALEMPQRPDGEQARLGASHHEQRPPLQHRLRSLGVDRHSLMSPAGRV